MRGFTDIFIKHPVLAAVVNLVIVLVGIRLSVFDVLKLGIAHPFHSRQGVDWLPYLAF